MIGRGTFGKVFLCALKGVPDEPLAMKCICKDYLLDTKMVESTKLEKEILFKMDHPFLVTKSVAVFGPGIPLPGSGHVRIPYALNSGIFQVDGWARCS